MILERRKFTLDEYHRLAETGLLGEDDRIELIDGEIIEMSPVGRAHIACINRNNRNLIRRLGDRAIVSVQNSIIIYESEPLPDIAILAPNPTDYADRLAAPEDILLIIEVADSSLEYDQKIKAPKYAKAGVQELWVVDLNDDMIWLYRNPSSKGYLDIKAYQRGETMAMLAFPEITLAVNDILGPQL